ncbi:MAG: DUF1540 domain-containing protein [Clostridia bacterium]|nr:DUF1540 domain-containing protein [Clostridia bacterium]
MANQNIMCTISSCHYWTQGNRCNAEEILVTSDAMAQKQPDSIDAPRAEALQAVSANSSMEACCKTFVHKNSDKINVDGVLKQ